MINPDFAFFLYPKDASLTGVSAVLSKMKNRFEAKEDAPLTLTRGVEKRKEPLIPAAALFEIQEQVNEAKESLAVHR